MTCVILYIFMPVVFIWRMLSCDYYFTSCVCAIAVLQQWR